MDHPKEEILNRGLVMNLLQRVNFALVGLVVAAMLSGCSDSTELLASGTSSAQATQEPGTHSCEIEHNSLLFAENIKSYSGFDAALVLPQGCAPEWDGMTEITLDASVKFERASGSKFKWIESQIPFANLSFTTDTDCQGPEWGCTPAPGRLSDAAAAAQLESLYGDCPGKIRNPCEVQIRFAATDYLTQLQPLFLWVSINRINVPGPNLDYSKWDPSQRGGTLTVVGTLNFSQVQP